MTLPPVLSAFSDQPVFNTKAVVHETSIPADTFRAWERRYGLPRPQRSEGGHRLYSARDIAIIRWLRDRTAEGMNISQAVQVLNSVLAAPPDLRTSYGRPLQQLSDDLVLALISFDTSTAERLCSEAFSLYMIESVLLEMFQPALIEIGERWHRQEISVANEHFASNFIRRKLAGLLNLFEGYAQHDTILLGCAPEEQHDLGILIIAIFLLRRGWRVIFLGAQVPADALLDSVRRLKPLLVCLSASTPATALTIAEIGRMLQGAVPELLFCYGGRAFNLHPELRANTPGAFLGSNALELSEQVAQLLQRPASERQV